MYSFHVQYLQSEYQSGEKCEIALGIRIHLHAFLLHHKLFFFHIWCVAPVTYIDAAP